MSETENPPLDPADPPETQGGGTKQATANPVNPDLTPADGKTADPPETQSGGG